MRRTWLVAILGVLAWLGMMTAWAEPAFVPPVVVVRKTDSALDALSKQGASILQFMNLKNKGVPSNQTSVQLAYDAENLYVCFKCAEANMGKLQRAIVEDDGPVWRDDSVEILLDPKRDGESYFHLVANAAGARFDAGGNSSDPKSWSGNWTVSVGRAKDAWDLVATIPFRSLGLPVPKPGTIWGANFGRHEVPMQEISSWSPVDGGFAEPARFGQIVFGDTDVPVATTSLPNIGAPGRYSLGISLDVAGKSPTRLSARVAIDGKPVEEHVGTVKPGQKEWRFTTHVAAEGKHHLSIAVADAAGKRTIFRTPPMKLDISPHRNRLDRYRAIVRALSTTDPALNRSIDDAKAALGNLVALERSAQGNAARWAQLGEKLDAIEGEIARLRYACADTDQLGYVLGTETPLRKVRRDRLFEGPIGDPVRISLAKNEHEAGQVLIIPTKTDLKGVSVSVSPLTGTSGAIIPPENVALNLVGFVKTRKPRYDVDYVGWYPDPLMDMEPFDVSAGLVQPAWVTVHTPADTPPGLYRGEVTVRPSNAPESSLPIEVRVWNFTLPTEPHLRTAFALFDHEIAAWYHGMTDEIRLAYYQFLLDHRLNPTNIYSRRPVPEKPDLPFCVERGLNAFSLAYTHNKSAEDREELKSMIKDYESYLRPRGWWGKAYLYGFDEIPREKYGELRDMYGWAKREFPDLPRMCTVIPNKDLKGYVDIWVPVTSNYVQKDAEEYTKAGDQVWWYVCCNPHHPYANFFIDYPAIDPRIIFWMNWKYHVPGFLYYALNNWQSNRTSVDIPNEQRAHQDVEVQNAVRSGKRWPEVPWNTFTFDNFNGDGQLIYPGPGGKPLSSIRLECIRDGIEDYEYFHMLDSAVKQAAPGTDTQLLARARRLLAVDDGVVRSLTDYTLEPQVLIRARQMVAEMIEQLASAKRGGDVRKRPPSPKQRGN